MFQMNVPYVEYTRTVDDNLKTLEVENEENDVPENDVSYYTLFFIMCKIKYFLNIENYIFLFTEKY